MSANVNIVHDNHWQDTMPDRTCADTPRTALGFCQKGVVDIPAIARLFVVCTYGRPYHSDTNEEAKMCHRLATFDATTKTCKCRKPENDILDTKLFPISEAERSYSRVFMATFFMFSYVKASQ
ncbi:hypothetical protein Y032_0017g3180 [Ancylostoma ceylanicum]|uniref:Uncharacterized protein n=1 Tax=Ancylostoma ceylanicum TaxID=53326 RepID=A0A016V4H4_9BILA|nr:hypothetical protein Y032_0017g3180 [Ancylostoma ceylanicum]